MKLLPFFLCGALILAPAAAHAQDNPVPAPRPRPNGPAAMVNFDEAMARDYLSRIDEQRNALSLQMGLFMGPRPSLGADQSIPLILEQAAKETPGSKRWAMLESLIGFGGFHAPGLNAEANTAYKLLFSTPFTEDAAPTVESALRTYLNGAAATGMGRGDSSTSQDVMLAALGAYVTLPEKKAAQTLPARPGLPMSDSFSWAGAARNSGSGVALAKDIEARLKTPGLTGAERLRVLRVGAELNEEVDAERAVELVLEASPLATQFSPDDVGFTNIQVRILAANGKLPDAIAALKASIAKVNNGRGMLLKLDARAGDTADFNATLDQLKLPTASEPDIQGAYGALIGLTGITDVDGPKLARELAQSYLAATRDRDPVLENSMKLNLASSLYKSGDKDGAIKLLQTVPVPAEDDMVGQRSYRAIGNVLKQMQAGNYNTY